jgi:DNA-binding IclR family transcriptional regulator
MAQDRVSQVPAATHTLRVLSFLASRQHPMAAQAIATALELPRSTVYHLLRVLQQQGFVVHYADSSTYGLGLAAFELSSGYLRQEPIARLGRPVIAALAARTGESSHLAVGHGREVTYIVEHRAARRATLVTDVGVRLPSHLTASGRAMLAVMPAPQVRALFPDKDSFVVRETTSDWTYGRLRSTLAEVRATGYAVEDEQVSPGLASVAVAVRDRSGWPVAAVATTFSKSQVEVSEWGALASVVRRYADLLSERIAGRPTTE